jgi:hypothetical protein
VLKTARKGNGNRFSDGRLTAMSDFGRDDPSWLRAGRL